MNQGKESEFGVHVAAALATKAYWADRDIAELDAIAEEIITDIEGTLEAFPLDEIYYRRQILQGYVKAAKELLARVDEHMVERLGPAGEARFSDNFVTTAAKVSTACHDPEGLRDYLGEDWPGAFNVNYPRKTFLREIAKLRGDDPDTVMDTFYTEELSTERKLVIKPVDKAPKRALEMKHGELRGSAR